MNKTSMVLLVSVLAGSVAATVSLGGAVFGQTEAEATAAIRSAPFSQLFNVGSVYMAKDRGFDLAPSAAVASGVIAQTPPGTAVPLSPELALEKACSLLKLQRAFKVEVDIAYDSLLLDGQKVQYAAYQTLSVQKPNRLRSEYVGDERVSDFLYDGKSFTLLSPQQNLYATRTAPATIDAAIDNLAEKYGVTIPLSNLVVTDPCTKLKPNTLDAAYMGFDLVNRVGAYHYLFTGKDRDWQLWISSGENPLPLKLVITYTKLPGAPQYTAVLSNWELAPTFSEETFTFKPPAGAVGIEFLPPADAKNISRK